jgi:hypothetical protein
MTGPDMDALLLSAASRESMATRLGSLCVRPAECLYFGCVEGPGHYLRGGSTGDRGDVRQAFEEIDMALCWSQKDQTQGRALVTRRNGWTALAFWDRSLDQRPGCNSVFFVRGNLTFAQMVWVSRHRWPKIWSRFSFQVVEVDANGRPTNV